MQKRFCTGGNAVVLLCSKLCKPRCVYEAPWYFVISGFHTVAKNYWTDVLKTPFFPLGKRRPRTTQSMGSFRRSRHQDIKRVASAPVVVNSYRNQVKAGIVRAMLPRSESSHLRSAFGAAEMWRSKLLTSRPTLEKGFSSKSSWPHSGGLQWHWIDGGMTGRIAAVAAIIAVVRYGVCATRFHGLFQNITLPC